MHHFFVTPVYQLRKWSVLGVLLILVILFGSFTASSKDETIVSNPVTSQVVQTATPPGQLSETGLAQTHTLFLPMISLPAQTEQPPIQTSGRQLTSNHSGHSPQAPPEQDSHTFVADTGGHLDQYLKRAEVPNGRLTFSIGVNAPVVNPEWVDFHGHLRPAEFLELVEKDVLSAYALLTLQIYDVDQEAVSCPELDDVYINGYQVQLMQQQPVATVQVKSDGSPQRNDVQSPRHRTKTLYAGWRHANDATPRGILLLNLTI